jgi:Na+-driven multidrug efflux pump
VFYIPFMYLFNALFGANGLACALLVGETCGAIFAITLLARWKRKNLVKKEI